MGSMDETIIQRDLEGSCNMVTSIWSPQMIIGSWLLMALFAVSDIFGNDIHNNLKFQI